MDLPMLNALLNTTATVLLLSALRAIRQRNIELHRKLMVAATATSGVFLASYLTHHYTAGHMTCVATGWVRTAYFLLLWPHVVLAAVIVPLVFRLLYLAAKDRRAEHRRLARVTFPMWLYVTITGVLIYLYSYQIFSGPEYFRAAGLVEALVP